MFLKSTPRCSLNPLATSHAFAFTALPASSDFHAKTHFADTALLLCGCYATLNVPGELLVDRIQPVSTIHRVNRPLVLGGVRKLTFIEGWQGRGAVGWALVVQGMVSWPL